MKRNQLYTITFAAASLGLLASCTAGRKSDQTVTVSPSPTVLTPDSSGQMHMDVLFRVPAHYMSQRSRLVILPQLVVGDSVKDEFQPLVIDAPIYNKKKLRWEVLDDYADPYAGRTVSLDRTSHAFELPYSQTVQLPEGTDNARVVGVVTTDGCGECSSIDTIDIASVSDVASLIDVRKSLNLVWIEPEFVVRPKVMVGKGVANLQFVINKHDINLSMGNNRKELEDMVRTLSPVLGDTLATLTSLDIYGMASADGSLAFNTPLARRRAEAAKAWLVNRLGIRPSVQRMISVGSRPEGWQPVLDAMTADGNPDSVAVKAILEKYADSNDDVQERYIRRLPCWKDIREKYLQKDRKVEYVYSYTIRSFTTDTELLEMYGKRPDAFNEDELLRVAVLTESHEGKKEVYTTIMTYFPQSQIAANNLAVLWLREGDEVKAREVLGTLKEYSPETLNTLAASYVYAGDYERAVELLQDIDLPEGRYNLGLLRAKQRRLHEAYELLRPFADVNSAIVALSVNRNDEAKGMLDKLTDNSPVTEYVRALTAARFDDKTVFYDHLAPACADERMRRRAVSEPDFSRYRGEEQFRRLVDTNKEDER